MGRLLAPAALLVLGCGRVVVVDTGAGTGATNTNGGGGTEGSTETPSGETPTGPWCGTLQLAELTARQRGFVLDGEHEGDESGSSVGGAGDVNGDGLADIIVGASHASPNGKYSGRTYVVFGKIDAASVALSDVARGIGGFALDGEAEYDYSGFSVDGAGDVNGDGLDDVIIGAVRADPGGIERAGRSYVVFGRTGTDAVLLSDVAQGLGGFAIDGEAATNDSGGAVSGAGDVNGDGIADVLVGADLAGPGGRAYVVFGKSDTETVLLSDVSQGAGGFVLHAEGPTDHAGGSVSAAGDVDGDGLGDVIVAARGASPHGYYSGRAYVVFGKADTNAVLLSHVAEGAGGFAMDGEAEGYSSGSVSGAGDVNGDGHDDLIVGAPGAGSNAFESGRTYVVFAKAGTNRVLLAEVASGRGGFTLDGEADEDRSGATLSGLGDLNGDGLADVIIGAASANANGDGSGRSYVVFGRTDTDPVLCSDLAQGIGGFVLDGAVEGDHAGTVGGAGDVNGDGVPDLAIGAGRADPDGDSSGRTYVVFGGDFSCAARALGRGGERPFGGR